MGDVLGFCGSLFPFCFPLSRCSFCIFLVYSRAQHAFFFFFFLIIKFDLTCQKRNGMEGKVLGSFG
jgi:hypothetical protein